MKTILVIDDEKDLIKLADLHLSKEGYLTIGAVNGDQGLSMAIAHKPDLIILDIMLPKTSGWDVCKRLKSTSETAAIPVIMLTARAMEADKILGLELGADDYITKPFSPRELVARVKAVLRRSEHVETRETIKLEGLDIDRTGRSVKAGGKKVELTATEFNILWHLASRRGRVISRDDLISAARGDDVVVVDRTIDVHVASLRKKLGRHGELIETVRSVGYKCR